MAPNYCFGIRTTINVTRNATYALIIHKDTRSNAKFYFWLHKSWANFENVQFEAAPIFRQLWITALDWLKITTVAAESDIDRDCSVYLCYSSAQAQPSWSRSVTFKTKNVQTASEQRQNVPLLLHSRCYQSILWGLELRVETFDKWFYLRREGLCSFLQISNASSLISSMFRVWKCPIVLKVKSKNTEAEYCLVLKISFDWIFAGKKSLKVAERRLK